MPIAAALVLQFAVPCGRSPRRPRKVVQQRNTYRGISMVFRTLLAIALTCVSLSGLAKSQVVVSLNISERASVQQDLSVELTFTNTGRQAVRLLNWFVPDGEIEDDVFTVSRNGEMVSYVGPHYKRPAATDADFVLLQPGQSITRSADIGSFYDFTRAGDYTIQYSVHESLVQHASGQIAHGRFGPELESASALESEFLASNVVGTSLAAGFKNRIVEAAMLAKADLTVASVVGQSTVAFSGRCSATQQATILDAVAAASNYSNGAVTYLNGTPAATQR
ncbi:MAG TPA: hypothetical protein VFV17_09095, partial [Usitatibacteraceae bacterium]|nr:hypothetical protein [Usitatibacteraceae bacterium]